MTNHNQFDVIIIGGSYSGLAAGMALGRARRTALIIEDGKPCNIQTPYSHNFLTQDGKTPAEITAVARQQVKKYGTIRFFHGVAIKAINNLEGFAINVASGEMFTATQLIFATGIRDILPDISGMAECWGISVLHCPFCHGYEVHNERTGILAAGLIGYDLAALIANWTKDLTIFSDGPAKFTPGQMHKLKENDIKIVEKEIERLEHTGGHLTHIVFKDGTISPLKAAYARYPFRQRSHIPESLGCELTEEGYIKIDPFHGTTIKGVYACGDSVAKIRTVANAVATGTIAGMTVTKSLIADEFLK